MSAAVTNSISGTAAAAASAVPGLSCSGLRKSYPDHTVLAGVDLNVAAGEVVAIRGASGTGKSTLLNCLGLLDRPDSGSISIAGNVATTLPDGARSRLRAAALGFVFQSYHLLPEFTVRENVMMPARTAGTDLGQARIRADALLARLGLSALAQAMPNRLSGGERQRVAVARALLNHPRVVLADEPTGNLDPATAAIVLDELLAMATGEGAAVVLVTHDPLIAARAGRTLHLANGTLNVLPESANHGH